MGVKLKPIIPKTRYNAGKIDKAINDAVAKTLKVGVGYFKKTTSSWNTDVKFIVDGPKGGEGAVGTDNDIYGYVARGTRPHLITPKRGKVLVFGEGTYKPKSRPGILGARRVGTGLRGAGGVARPVFAKRVHHPGTKARGFEEEVAARLQPVLETNVTAAILEGIG